MLWGIFLLFTAHHIVFVSKTFQTGNPNLIQLNNCFFSQSTLCGFYPFPSFLFVFTAPFRRTSHSLQTSVAFFNSTMRTENSF